MRRLATRRVVVVLAAVAMSASVACNKAPTSPERHGIAQVTIVCAPATSTQTLCRAPVGCELYPCTEGTPSDVTTVASWSVDDSSVARVVSPGFVESVGVGHTVLRVRWSYTSYFIAIGVFPGTAPLPTYEYEGTVFDGGAAAARTPLDGALVEILTGLPAGRSTVSGALPDAYPGASVVKSPGHYAFFGIPEGTYRLRISKPGYVTQEIDTTQFADVTLVPAR